MVASKSFFVVENIHQVMINESKRVGFIAAVGFG